MFLKEKLDPPIVEIPQPLEPWRQVLLDAAQRLRERGWCQHALCNVQTGANCALGAMYDFRPTGERKYKAFVSFNDGAGASHEKLTTFLNEPISEWNNAPGRTAEEVINTLEKVARS